MEDKDIIKALISIYNRINLLPVTPIEHCKWKISSMEDINVIIEELKKRETEEK